MCPLLVFVSLIGDRHASDIEQDFPYESDNIDNSHNRDLDTDI